MLIPVFHTRAAVAEELRRLLPQMEGDRAAPIPLGLTAIDRCLPQGGLAGGALHEIVPEAGAMSAAFGFLVALLATILPRKAGEKDHAQHGGGGATRAHQYLPPPPLFGRSPSPAPLRFAGEDERRLFFVFPHYGFSQYGRLCGHGFNALGLDPHRLIVVETAQRKDMLWAMEEVLRSRAVAAVAGVVGKLDLKSSQRLAFTAAKASLPLFLLRQAEMLEASAAATRWRVGSAPAARDRFGLFTHARWHLLLERCRNGRAGEWMVEYDHVAHRFSLPAPLAAPAFPRDAREKREKSVCQTR